MEVPQRKSNTKRARRLTHLQESFLVRVVSYRDLELSNLREFWEVAELNLLGNWLKVQLLCRLLSGRWVGGHWGRLCLPCCWSVSEWTVRLEMSRGAGVVAPPATVRKLSTGLSTGGCLPVEKPLARKTRPLIVNRTARLYNTPQQNIFPKVRSS